MTAKNARAASSQESGSAMLAPLNWMAELPRRQLALMTQSASALMRVSEEVRQIQQQAVQRASAHHEEVREKLGNAHDLGELLAIQQELLRFNMQEATQYWQQLAGAALKVPAQLSSAAREAEPEPTLDALQRAFEASLQSGTGSAAPH
jgi:Rad3-related DNA helicase